MARTLLIASVLLGMLLFTTATYTACSPRFGTLTPVESP